MGYALDRQVVPRPILKMCEEGPSGEYSDLVIVEADEPLLFFPSIRAAEQYLEPQDVANAIYPRAWGGDGRTYRIENLNGRVTLKLEAGSRTDPQMLRVLLTQYLASQGVRVSPMDPLPRLLSHCMPYVIR